MFSPKNKQNLWAIAGVIVCFLFTLTFVPKWQTTQHRTNHPGTEHNPSQYRYSFEKYMEESERQPASKKILLGTSNRGLNLTFQEYLLPLQGHQTDKQRDQRG